MRRFVNLIISGVVLWAASMLFTEQIHIKDFSTLFLSTLLMWLATVIVSLIAILIMKGGMFVESCSWTLFGLIIYAASRIIALYMLDAWLPGFTVEGFWLKVLIAFACSFFSLSESETYVRRKDNNGNNPPPPTDLYS